MAKSRSTPLADFLRLWPRFAFGLMGLSIAIAGVAVLRDLVERRYAWPSTAPRIVLVNRPQWMSDATAQAIIDSARPVGVHSVFDVQLLKTTAAELGRNPWIKQVKQVRRAYVHWPGDTLEVDCVYRVPAALVQWQGFYWLVDSDGFMLPEQYTRPELKATMLDNKGKLNLRVIQGVTHAPVLSGHLWPGDDLAAGLELVKLLAGRSFSDQLPVIDVSNFNGRHDSQAAQIVLITRYGTTIRWGRPPSAADYFVEIPASQKLADLMEVDQQMHRVDGGQPWIDIRFDQVTYPSPQPAAATSSTPSPSDLSSASANAN